MSKWTIDPKLCKGDGFCVAECPSRLFEIPAGSQVPVPVADAESRCVNCGHCVAVCPAGAIKMKDMLPEDCLPAASREAPDLGLVEYMLRRRHSVRVYRDKPVEKAQLEKLADLARYAPTGGNSQLVKWLMIHSRERVREVAEHVIDMMGTLGEKNREVSEKYRWPRIIKAWQDGVDGITRGAPALVVAHVPKNYRLGDVDASIALTYLDLAAPSLGLGTCWAGFVMLAIDQWPPLQKLLALPEERKCCGVMMVGYPKYAFQRFPERNPADLAWRE